MKTLDDYMAYGWEYDTEPHAEGGYRLTVRGLDDFELFGEMDELMAEWRDALRGHLRAYMQVQKAIPTVTVTYSQPGRTPVKAEGGQVYALNAEKWVSDELQFA